MERDQHTERLLQVSKRFPCVAFVWRMQAGWPVEYVSGNVVRLLGFSVDDFISGRVQYADLVHPEDRMRLQAEMNAGIAARRSEPWEQSPYRMQRQDGSFIWIQDRTRYVVTEGDGADELEGVITDISRTVEMSQELERTLAAVEDRNRSLLTLSERLSEIEGVVSSSADMLVLIGGDREVRYANTAFLRTFGLLDSIVPGTPLHDLPGIQGWHPEVERVFDRVLAGESHEWSTWCPIPVLGQQFLYLSVRPFISPRGGKNGVVLVLRNQTRQQERTQALRRLETAIEQVSESIVITNANGVIEYVNPFFERTSGYSSQEVLGRTPGVLKSGTLPESFYKDLWGTLLSGRTWSGRFVNRRKNGDLYTEDATISPIVDAGGAITHFVAVKRDISSDVVLAQQLQLAEQLESRSQVYRNMFHEFNDHLAVILGHSELMSELAGQGLFREESVATITEQTRALSSLVHTAMERDARRESSEPGCDLAAVVRRSADMMGRILPESIEFHTHICARDLPVLAAAQDVDLMVTNLLLNADDAINERGKISLHVDLASWLPDSLRKAGQETRFVQVEVTDSGKGMDEYTKAHLFDQFFTTRSDAASSGLGLWRVRQLLDSLGGDADVDSAPGRGTRMTLWIPLLQDAIYEDGPEDALALSSMSVVLVDDDPAYLQMTTAMLTLEDVRVRSFDRPERALTWLLSQDEQPDLLMAEEQMPALAGHELAATARKHFPELEVVLLTGHSEESSPQSPLENHPPFFLRKPFEANDLHHMLMRVRSRQCR